MLDAKKARKTFVWLLEAASGTSERNCLHISAEAHPFILRAETTQF